MNELLKLYRAHTGKVSDRWLAYLKQYDELFAPWRDRPLRLLEIGIQNGGSLEIWGLYFPKASVLVGCDIDPLCAGLTYDDPRIRVVVGDASIDDTEFRITEYSPEWDIVIEDGSHHSRHIVDAFARFFPRVAVGGMFIAEDLHCGYWREFEGGLADPFSSIAFFKRLADLVNFEHWGIPASRSEYLMGFAEHYGCSFDDAVLSQIHSVEFVNSQCIVRKREIVENMLGPRLIVGQIENVSKGARNYEGTLSRALDQTSNPWSDMKLVNVADRNIFEARLATMDVQLTLKVEQIRLLEEDVAQLMSDLAARDEQIAILMLEQSKPSARIGRLIERIAKKLFPIRSRRRKTLVKMWGFADRVNSQGVIGALRSIPVDGGDVSLIRGVVANDALAQPPQFAAWIRAYEPDDTELAHQRMTSASHNPAAPLFSLIVPVYKVPSAVLETTIASVRNQTWQDWEMCIVYADIDNADNWALLERLAKEDPRLRLRRITKNGGISLNSNAALEFACGEFVVLLDHDDELTPWALHDMAHRIAAVPDADFLYSDKDSINASGTLRQNPLFKPAWSPEMMFSVNYLTHLNVMRRSIVQALGGWNPETDGAQDWDIFLRVAEKSRRIERVPGIHYHWRIIAGSTATGIGAKPYALLSQLRTLEMRIRRLALDASVHKSQESGYQLVWHLENRPHVDVVLHGECDDVASITSLLVDQLKGALASVTLCWSGFGEPPAVPRRLTGGVPFTVVRSSVEDKTSAIADAVDAGSGAAVMLLDVAVKRLSRQSLRDLAGWVLKHPEIGFSSALVLLEDDTVVEAGRVVGLGGATQPLFRGMPLRHWGPFGGPLWYRNVSAAGDTAIVFKRDRLELSKYKGVRWSRALVAICADVCGTDRRGVVVPHSRVFVERMPELSDTWHESMKSDPYFHPAFKSVVPLALDLDKQ